MDILIVDDDELLLLSLEEILCPEGHAVRTAAGGEEALVRFEEAPADVVLLDLSMPGMDGMTVLERLKRSWPRTTVIVLTAFASVHTAVRAMRRGAHDLLPKPVAAEVLLRKLENLEQVAAIRRENEALRKEVNRARDATPIIGQSHGLRMALERVDAVADSDATVLVVGESGTGKDLIARALHAQSPRRSGPFVKVSCAALPESLLEDELFGHEAGSFTGATGRRLGKFEAASGGTVLLDDVDDLEYGFQGKLLRVIEEKRLERLGGNAVVPLDIRILASTKRPLYPLTEGGAFRLDLYFRLSVVTIQLPPLRARGRDVALQARHFLDLYAEQEGRGRKQLAPDALKLLARHPWPGNVRELEHLMRSVVLLLTEETVHARDLEPLLMSGAEDARGRGLPAGPECRVPGDREFAVSFDEHMERFERGLLSRALARASGNRTRAAQLLDLPRTTFCDKIRRYHLIEGSGGERGPEGQAPPGTRRRRRVPAHGRLQEGRS